MNTARLAVKWKQAEGDCAKMAAALGEELDDKENGYLTRDHLDAALSKLKADLCWAMLVQTVVLLVAIVAICLTG